MSGFGIFHVIVYSWNIFNDYLFDNRRENQISVRCVISYANSSKSIFLLMLKFLDLKIIKIPRFIFPTEILKQIFFSKINIFILLVVLIKILLVNFGTFSTFHYFK